MIPLAQRAGIEAWVDPSSGQLELGEAMVAEDIGERDLETARAAYWQPPAETPSLYHMLNGITPRGRREPESPLRYELTSLRPGTVGPEYVKTIGHLHDLAPDGLGYPEAYEVVSGQALFVLFRVPQEAMSSADPLCAIVEANPGDQFVIPPGWHHLAVNPGAEAMVFADVVGRQVAPDYSQLFRRRGAPAYLLPDEIRRNPRWPAMPVVRIGCPTLRETLPAEHGRLADAYFAGDRGAFAYLLKPAAVKECWAAFDETVAAAPPEQVATDPNGALKP